MENRNGESVQDPRLNLLKKEWFEGKNCLEIGCSNGVMAINIAKMFSCQCMRGIDIDPDHIQDANLNLTSEDKQSPTRNLSDIVIFNQLNIVESQSYPQEYYDTILCLDVTHWIDSMVRPEDVISLFWKIRSMLRPGGLFVLEAENFVNMDLRVLLGAAGFQALNGSEIIVCQRSDEIVTELKLTVQNLEIELNRLNEVISANDMNKVNDLAMTVGENEGATTSGGVEIGEDEGAIASVSGVNNVPVGNLVRILDYLGKAPIAVQVTAVGLVIIMGFHTLFKGT